MNGCNVPTRKCAVHCRDWLGRTHTGNTPHATKPFELEPNRVPDGWDSHAIPDRPTSSFPLWPFQWQGYFVLDIYGCHVKLKEYKKKRKGGGGGSGHREFIRKDQRIFRRATRLSAPVTLDKRVGVVCSKILKKKKKDLLLLLASSLGFPLELSLDFGFGTNEEELHKRVSSLATNIGRECKPTGSLALAKRVS